MEPAELDRFARLSIPFRGRCQNAPGNEAIWMFGFSIGGVSVRWRSVIMSEYLNIGLESKARAGVVSLLQPLLSDLVVLSAKNRAAHWGIHGLHFASLHALFGSQYESIESEIDEVAERIRSLGHVPVATLGGLLAGARLKDGEVIGLSPVEQVKALLADHEALIRSLRAAATTADEEYCDAGTNDFLVGLMASHEKSAWMLRASAA